MSALRTFALAAVAAAALAGSAQAQTATPGNLPVAGQRGHANGRGRHAGPFRNLNLTDAQKAQLKAIHAKYQPQRKASREQEMNEIRAVLTAEQRTKLDAAIAHRKEERGERPGKRGHWKREKGGSR